MTFAETLWVLVAFRIIERYAWPRLCALGKWLNDANHSAVEIEAAQRARLEAEIDRYRP